MLFFAWNWFEPQNWNSYVCNIKHKHRYAIDIIDSYTYGNSMSYDHQLFFLNLMTYKRFWAQMAVTQFLLMIVEKWGTVAMFISP